MQVAVIDVDCSLYSYLELASSQKLHFVSLIGDLFKKQDHLHESADKVFLKYATPIEKRIDFLIQFFGKDKFCFYSSYPITPAKFKMFSQWDVSFQSSFPQPKTAQNLLKFYDRKIDLVIGDRKVDKKLAKDLKAEWRGYPYYNYRHLLSGQAYTNAFMSLFKRHVCEKERI